MHVRVGVDARVVTDSSSRGRLYDQPTMPSPSSAIWSLSPSVCVRTRGATQGLAECVCGRVHFVFVSFVCLCVALCIHIIISMMCILKTLLLLLLCVGVYLCMFACGRICVCACDPPPLCSAIRSCLRECACTSAGSSDDGCPSVCLLAHSKPASLQVLFTNEGVLSHDIYRSLEFLRCRYV